MAWVKLEDTFSEHPKVQMAGDLAAWLYVSGLLYCSRAMTDGFIPDAKVSQLTTIRAPHKQADQLVRVGLWEAVAGGYQIHDYLAHQQSAAARRDKQEKDAERQRLRRSRVTEMSQRDNGGSHGPSHGAVTALSHDQEVEVEGELPPPYPPQGGRERDRSGYELQLGAWTLQHFPKAEPNHVRALAAHLRGLGLTATPAAMREYASQHPQWSPGIVGVAA